MNLPIEFEKQTISLLDSSYEAFKNALLTPSPTSIRLNPSKMNVAKHSVLAPIPWSINGRYLKERPMFTADPLFHGGAYYVQEASSMMIEQVIHRFFEADQGYTVLDLCASPGGKTTHLISQFSSSSLIVANETIKSRTSTLVENVIKWGQPNCVVTHNDSADFKKLGTFFDFILVDAPCSGEGMFRKQKDSIAHWSVDNVKLCAARQKRILANAWACLKPGGFLLYSTCTYNQQENEEVIRWLDHQEQLISHKMSDLLNFGVLEYQQNGIFTYRCMPHQVKGEGFSFTLIQKPETAKADLINTKRIRPNYKRIKDQEILDTLRPIYRDHCFEFDDTLRVFPDKYLDKIALLKKRSRVLYFGVKLSDKQRKINQPSHEFAVSHCIQNAYFSAIDLPYDQALRYLRGEVIQGNNLSMGWHIVRYKNIPLGFAKNIGSRMNNKYPKNLRILSSVDKLANHRFSVAF